MQETTKTRVSPKQNKKDKKFKAKTSVTTPHPLLDRGMDERNQTFDIPRFQALKLADTPDPHFFEEGEQ